MTSICAAGPAAANESVLDMFTVTSRTTMVDLSIYHCNPRTLLSGGDLELWLKSSRNCFKNVEFLSLTGQQYIRADEFAGIAEQMPKLKVIDFSGTGVLPSVVLGLLAAGPPTLEKIHVAYNTWDDTLPRDEIVYVIMMMAYGPERLVINEMPDLDEIEPPDLGWVASRC